MASAPCRAETSACAARGRARRALSRSLVATAILAFSATGSPPARADSPSAAPEHGEDDCDGWFVDRDGHVRELCPTYRAWFAPREPDPLAAIVVTGGIEALGLLYYWVDPLANSADWDDPPASDRFVPSRTLRFDTNLNTTNHLLHPFAGALLYGTSRVNGLGIPAAFGLAMMWSLAWELGFEWREKPSLNDLVYTPFGGAPLGEFAFHLGDYLDSAPGGGRAPQKVAGTILGAPRRVRTLVHGEEPPEEAMPPDDLGFSSAYGHSFGIGYELATLSNDAGDSGTMQRVRIDAAVIAMPGFLRPGSFSSDFADGNFTELALRLGSGAGANDEADLEVRATLAGRFAQSIREDEEGRPHGHATMIGVGPALRFDATSWLGRRDQLSAVHFPGPQADVWLALGDLRARLGGDAYFDFGSIQSLAYARGTNEPGTKSVLQREGYQFSVGATARVRGSVELGALHASSSASYSHYESIEGLDRFQERVTRDLHGTEDVLELRGDAGVRVSIVDVGLGIAERRRGSRLGSVSAHRWDRDLHLHAGIVF